MKAGKFIIGFFALTLIGLSFFPEKKETFRSVSNNTTTVAVATVIPHR